MNVLFYTRPPRTLPSKRYRVLQFLEPLKEHGIDAEVRNYPESLYEAWQQSGDIAGFDTVVFQKKRLGRFHLWLLQDASTKFLYDYDDAIMYKSSRHDSHYSFTRQWAFRTMVKQMDGVLAGNRYLMDLASEYCSNVYYAPTVIDQHKYTPRSDYEFAEKGPVIGWIGGSGTLEFLKDFRPILEEIGREHDSLRLKIVCSESIECNHVDVEFSEWSEETEAADVASFDIGISPMPDDRWTRGKCGAKLLQYMACGVPTVSSAVGAHHDICGEEEWGLLADDDESWKNRINQLLHDRQRREEFGQKGRARVEDAYSIEFFVPKLADYLR